jgi:hypothetical protein
MELFQYQDLAHTSLLLLDRCQVLKLGELREITRLVPMVLVQELTILDSKLKQVVRLKLEEACAKISVKIQHQVQELTSTQKIQQKVSLFRVIKADKI